MTSSADLPAGEDSSSGAKPRRPVPLSLPSPHQQSTATTELRALLQDKLFVSGLIGKLMISLFLAGPPATRWFAPFVYQFTHHPLTDPFRVFLERGEPQAFPYGPVMLGILSLPMWPFAWLDFDPAGPLGLLLLRIPVLAADFLVLLLLVRWLRVPPRPAAALYWLNPIAIFACYVHGQLDIIPTAIFLTALAATLERRVVLGGMLFAAAMATKAHLLLALPFVLLYLYRRRHPRRVWLRFSAVVFAAAVPLLLPVILVPSYRTMALFPSESSRLLQFVTQVGGVGIYPAPALVGISFLALVTFRNVNRDLTLMVIGAVYIALMAVLPPQPGWFVWSLPFVVYLAALYTKARRLAQLLLPLAYLLYFAVATPGDVLASLDPLVGPGFGEAAGVRLTTSFPTLFSVHGERITWTFLFCATVATALLMYRRGVQTNALYTRRDLAMMVGIGGDSGTGKHSLAEDLKNLLGDQLTVTHGDDDHRWERGATGWNFYTHLNPRANNLANQAESLRRLRAGGFVQRRHYDHDVGRFTDPVTVQPAAFIAVVGLHPFYLRSMRILFDLKVFMDPPEEIRRQWKIDRDAATRGYTPEKVIESIDLRWEDSVRFVHPQRAHADLVFRVGAPHTRGTESVSLDLEMASHLDTMSLLDQLEQLKDLEVEWAPDETLARDRIKLRGTASSRALVAVLDALMPNLDDFVDQTELRPGGDGVMQLIVIHALGTLLRSGQGAKA